ncbi:hypothetical protein pdam_00025406 [Pocillopora damicornis]|uniref:DDE-1 domain-containing protein n=1 Tax=Pocillopora damicornis TaxID=46731 RepID=A0A3M6UE01_POCDA|nr:hypothetical protein pdam_00025406 [Pocillopora damicornis]
MSLAESPCAKRARVQQLQLLLQENRRELAQCRQRVARWAAKRGNLGLTSAGQKAVLACYCLSNYNSAIATKLAQQLSDLERSSPQFPSEPLVQSLFRETNLGELLRLHSDDDDWTKARNVAVRFVAEVKTVDYVHSQNSLHGVAPTSAEVKCFWKMLAFQRGPEACDGREILYLNVDETSVPYTARPAIGCVINRKQYKGSGLPAVPHAKIQPAGRRGTFTYCAVIASNTGIQPALPHFLVSNGTRLSSKVVKAFKCLPKTQLQVLRRKSAWVTSDLMIAILQEVAKALEPFLHQFRPVLLLDGAPAHVSEAVMRAARKLNISLVYIPCGATSLCQPLDVYAFSSFKQYLRQKYHEHRQTATDGLPSTLAWLWQLGQAPRQFFCSKSWAKCFRGVGASGKASDLHSVLASFMEHPTCLPASSKPTSEDVRLIWPQNRRMKYAYACLYDGED